MSLLSIFGSAILPIVAVAAVGFVLARYREVDPGPLNTATVYVLAPALVLHSLAVTDLGGGTILKLTVGTVAYVVLMVAISEAVGRLLGRREPMLSALVLVATFPNAGNYGIPVSAFAFGSTGRSTAVLYLAVQAVLMYTVGVYIASRSGGVSGLAGVGRVLRIPLGYAVVVALAARWFDLVPPASSTAMATLKLVGDSAIPVMLLILGIQLANTDYGPALRAVGPATLLKLGVAPVVAVAVALGLGFGDPTAARVFVLQSATPAAITPLILLLEFAGDAEVGGVTVPEFVSAVVMVTTLVSIPLVTVLIAVLQSGAVI